MIYRISSLHDIDVSRSSQKQKVKVKQKIIYFVMKFVNVCPGDCCVIQRTMYMHIHVQHQAGTGHHIVYE